MSITIILCLAMHFLARLSKNHIPIEVVHFTPEFVVHFEPEFQTKAYENGTLLTGLSAGSICWFEEGVSEIIENPEIPAVKRHANIKALGLLKGSHCPHFDGEEYRAPIYKNWIIENKIQSGYAVDDGVGIHFIDGIFQKVVSSCPNAKAFYLSKTESSKLGSKVINPIYLWTTTHDNG